MGKWRDIADLVVRAAIDAADAAQAVRRAWTPIADGPLLALSIGKASVAMARAADELLAHREFAGIVTAAPECAASNLGAHWRVFPCDHPLATRRNVDAALHIESHVREFALRHAARGSLVVLVSGGGSAHLTLPAEPIPLDEYTELQRRLMLAGATINELNVVRKHCERLKGGRLAALAGDLRVRALVISDVIGDPLDVIASGPLAPDPSTFADAIGVIAARGCTGVSTSVDTALEQGTRGQRPETPKPGDPVFDSVESRIISGNVAAVLAVGCAIGSHSKVTQQRTAVTGEARSVAIRIVDALAADVASRHAPSCIIWGGEPTVSVGDLPGRGGPSQEVALAAAIELERRGMDDACVITFSTDGIDGPTCNAGGIGDAALCRELQSAGHDPAAMLAMHDSATALEYAGKAIKTGPTGTNVNHVFIACSDRGG
ncbi:MAG: DUF4147 domain-containing protein [Phycisphaerales bacterium]|nr:DUF4147 domain-containing protein [Phycisphaerales bacterium]